MMLTNKKSYGLLLLVFLIILAPHGLTAYKAHDNDYDSEQFLLAYPDAQGSKLDNCYLCHTGGQVGKKYLNSCEYCHEVYGLKPPYGDSKQTLNAYGLAYLEAGRSQEACLLIGGLDSDGDGFTNEEEIRVGRLPGDKDDTPNTPEAPAVFYTREKLRSLPKTKQFMALDTAKSGDYYTEYVGIDVWTLLKDAGIRKDATDITVFAADGYSMSFDLADIKQKYPQGQFWSKFPWIDFPANTRYRDGDKLSGSLKYLIAFEREGIPLQTSKIVVADGRARLDGEGPYRFISPLHQPVVPDRSQWSIDRDDQPYPYNPNRPVIRNADACIKSIVAIRVNTKDNKSFHYDWSGQAWKMIDNGELVIYGAINK